MNEFEAAETVTRPIRVPGSVDSPAKPMATLKRHGLEVQELREDIELDLEVYKVDAIERSPVGSRAITRST